MNHEHARHEHAKFLHEQTGFTAKCRKYTVCVLMAMWDSLHFAWWVVICSYYQKYTIAYKQSVGFAWKCKSCVVKMLGGPFSGSLSTVCVLNGKYNFSLLVSPERTQSIPC
jgi:hypothetical protein